ncbi:phosphatase PAP2 family protein [Sphingomonas sinipercae]|nr:phosphatase PAP2 family protein [Sphingomonas sinipercae]
MFSAPPQLDDPNAQAIHVFRMASLALVLAAGVIALLMVGVSDLRLDLSGSWALLIVLATFLLVGRWSYVRGRARLLGDGINAFALLLLATSFSGMISLLGLHQHFELVDTALLQLDKAIGIDDLAVLRFLAGLPTGLIDLLARAYNDTTLLMLLSMAALTLVGDRRELWRAMFCFTGSLPTVCLLSIATPAKGVGVWASAELLKSFPGRPATYFWQTFDTFYAGDVEAIRLDSLGAVVSFPSFHTVMGLIVLTMWRQYRWVRPLAGLWFAVMLVGTIPFGGHYFVDLIAGALVWALWFELSRMAERRAVPAQHLAAVPA